MRDFKLNPYFGGAWYDRLDIITSFRSHSSSGELEELNNMISDLQAPLFCVYGGASYEGAAEVYFLGKEYNKLERKVELLLYNVSGGHCSCYGLEGQWKPVLTTVEAVQKFTLSDYEHEKKDIEAFEEFKQWLLEHKAEFKDD